MTERYSTPTLKIRALSNLAAIATYTSALVWNVIGRQDMNASSGKGSFQFYASQAALLADLEDNLGQVVTVYTTDQVASGAKMDLATFIIKSIETTTEEGVSIVTVSGPEVTDQLRNKHARDNAIDNGSGGPATNDVTQIMGYAPSGWSLTNDTATADGTYHAAKGDTVLKLLNAAAQQSGEVFRLDTYADPTSKGLFWANSPDSSGMTLRMPASYNQYDSSTTVGKLYSLRRAFDFEPVITRIRPFGAGVGDGRLDITSIDSGDTGADPAWLDTDFANNWMINTTLEATLGYEIEADIDFPWIQAADPSNGTQLTSAAVALWKTAKNFLLQNDSTRKFYTAECNVAVNLRPGQNITLVYGEYEGGPSGGNQTINDNLSFIILSVENRYEEGERITTLTLGDKPLPQPTAAQWVADVAEKTQDTTRKSDVGTSPGAVSTSRTLYTTLPLRIAGGGSADLSADRTLTLDGLSSYGAANQLPGANAAATGWEYKTIAAGTGISIGHSAGVITVTNTSPGGADLSGVAFMTIGNSGSLTNERAFAAGAGLAATDGGANSTYTVNVVAADTSLTINANDMQVRLAAASGLQVSSGLQVADSIAGAGLVIASKVLAVGAGDGINVAADSIAVDVTDLVGTGLIEEATNNIAVDFSVVAAQVDLHDAVTLEGSADTNLLYLTASQGLGLDSQVANQIFAGPAAGANDKPAFRSLVDADIPASIARDSELHDQVHVLATTSGLGPDHTVSGLTAGQVLRATGATTAAFASIQATDLPTGATLSVSSGNSGNSHAITSSSAVTTATAVLLATNSNGYTQVRRLGTGITPSANFHAYDDSSSTAELMILEQDGAGDAALRFTLSATISWRMGIDNANGDVFKIAKGPSAFGTADYLQIDTDGRWGVGRTPESNIAMVIYKDDALTDPVLKIEQDGAGDAALRFTLSATQSWTIGIDNSDGDKFKISRSAALGSSDIVEISATGVDIAETVTIDTGGDQGDRFLMTNANVSGSSVFYDFNQTDRDAGSTGAFELGFYRDANNITQVRMSKEIFEIIIRDGGTYYFPLEVRGQQVILAELPTSNPGIVGALYRSGSQVLVST